MEEEFEQSSAGETQSNWKTYGAPVLGAIIILAVLTGGYYLWQNRQTPTPQRIANSQKTEDKTPTPEATVTMPNNQAETGEEEIKEEENQTPVGDTDKEKTVEKGKKPEQLPETGFNQVWLLLPSLLLAFAGHKLQSLKRA